MQDAPPIANATSDQSGTIDWTELGSFIRRTATIATIEHLHQQRIHNAGGMMPARRIDRDRDLKRETDPDMRRRTDAR